MPLPGSRPGRPRAGRLLLGAAVPWWRRSRRRAGRFTMAAALAAVALGVVQVRADEAARIRAGLGRTRTVVVARHDLAPGHVIGDDDTVARTLPVDALPDGAIDQRPTGRTVTAAVVAGEVVSARRLAPDGVDGLAALVPPGRRAIALPTEGSGLRLQVGDHVDVLDPSDGAAYADGSSAPAGAAATDALVIAVDDTTVTVAVERDDAPSVARALAGGTPVLAMTGADPDG
ncbi:MAG: Flp pilus assembly protein CpaB [Acidimicrobiales bacterium]